MKDTISPLSIEALISNFSDVIAHKQYESISALLSSNQNSFEVHFLDASYHAEQNDYMRAKNAFLRSLNINPQFHIARFQLCFLALLNEDFDILNSHIEQLLMLGEDNYLATFAKALVNILQDNTEQAKALLTEGILLNDENLALNENMNQLLYMLSEELHDTSSQPEVDDIESDLSSSNNSILLDIYNNKFN
ncbi:tetratricopeptide repeat protein [Pseudoalteromonas piscicida]|uniref:tetratricopeptide repeat protein n=1 Tax=Pseudoalteromonas piscicida TaxID=43662 RepID=UPI003C7A25A3